MNLANQNYQPAYSRHSNYRGSWNGSYGGYGGYRRGYGFGNDGFGTGLGLGLGLGLLGGGYGGYGWGGGYGWNDGYGWNNGWNDGYGGGWYGGRRGFGRYSYRPLGWGLGAWGLGSLAYNSGYLGYSNPYYINDYGMYGTYSYAQPIPVAYTDVPLFASPEGPVSCEESLNNAISAFQQDDYNAALDIINKGLVLCPDDSVMHEFRALSLFAKGDYQQAAATVHSVLAVGPGWNWATLSSMYSSVPAYTVHLRALEGFTKANPLDGASRFLLAYHYMADGYPDAAERQLRQVVKLMPNDRVAADLLMMVEVPAEGQLAESPLPAAPPSADPNAIPTPAIPAVDPAMLIGVWKATRDDKSNFELTLAKDSTFLWKFTHNGQVQEFGGTYTLEGNVLALQRKEGGSLIAGILPEGNQKFNFKMIGAPSEDQGLNFSR